MAGKTSPEADADFAKIYAFGLEGFGRAQAEAYAIGLLDLFDMLAANPRLGRERSEIAPPVRLIRYRSHHVLYLVRGKDVLILRIVHGSVDWTALFSGEP